MYGVFRFDCPTVWRLSSFAFLFALQSYVYARAADISLPIFSRKRQQAKN